MMDTRLLSLAATLLLPVSLLAQEQNVEDRFPVDTRPQIASHNVPTITSYADVLRPARDAVVSVTSARIVESMQRPGRNPMEEFLRRFYGLPMPEQPEPHNEPPQERRVPYGLGSGVIISADGYILTNNHVIVDKTGQPADELDVILNDRSQVRAEVVGRDERTDVALLKIDRTDLPYLPIGNSDELQVGDLVFAIGNPLGIGQTSTMGIVSAVGRANLGLLGEEGYEYFIQTDAAINRGNSGGALIDAYGRLIGINTAIYSQTGGNIGIGFAIPINMARSIALELLSGGEVRRGYLGVSIRDIDANLAEAFSLERPMGALVQSVEPGTPAQTAGIKRGDVIVSIDGTDVESVAQLRMRIASLRPGQTADFGLIREGERQNVKVELGSLAELGMSGGSDEGSPLEGVRLVPASPAVAQEWNLKAERGLVITGVAARSPFAGRLEEGMVILEANDQPVNSVKELKEALRPNRVNKLWVSYRGNELFLGIRIR